ncbi:MAG: quaternary ammonium compound efflux SMR transporter SugE [Aliiglaciecola sp.]
MSWFYLVLAGIFEAGWLISIVKSESFSKPQFIVIAVLSMALSLTLFSISLDEIPITVAYLVWLAVGAVSLVLIDVFVNGTPILIQQLFFISLIVIGIVGIKVSL